MSEAKSDRSIAPRVGTRASRAKQAKGRTITPPPPKYHRPAKPKKGERVMEKQLAVVEPAPTKPALLPGDQEPPEQDPWWVEERERCFRLVLSGTPQHQIANELGRDRHTIARWMEDERFLVRLQGENESRFRAMQQRRTMQTVRLTDKAYTLAETMMDEAESNPKDMGARLAARDWLSEFREQSRREDEIYGLDKQRVDVNVHGTVNHKHKGVVANLSFKEFLAMSMQKLGVDVDAEEVDAAKADEALIAIAERSLTEGTFLDELVKQEKEQALLPMLDR